MIGCLVALPGFATGQGTGKEDTMKRYPFWVWTYTDGPYLFVVFAESSGDAIRQLPRCRKWDFACPNGRNA